MCLEIENKFRQEHEGKWITRGELQKLTKQCVPLHAKGIHHVVHKYIYARDAALQAMKGNGVNNRFPNKKKTYFNTGWDSQSVKVKGNKLILTVPLESASDGKRTKGKPIQLYIKNPPDNIVQVELIYRNGYRLSVKYIENIEILQVSSNNHAAIDLGEIHTITSIDCSGRAVIITGRKMRSIKQQRNKIQAKLYKRISNCTKDSRQYVNYKKALSNMTYAYRKKIDDCVHKITKKYVDYCIANNISVVYYGDLDSATRNTKGRVRTSTGQKLQQFNHGEVIKHLDNKLSRYGIKMIKVKEYYTSQKCPKCNKLNKPEGRCYKCKYCNYKQHRDIVGAINILNDNAKTSGVYYKNLKYLRID